MSLNLLSDQIINACSIGAGIAMIIALCEWVVNFFYRAITDKLGRGSRV